MPYPSQVNRETIVETARTLFEREGVEQLSLNKLAAALNIKAPSLYRHVDSKAALIQAVNLATNQQLVTTIGAAVAVSDDPKTRIARMALAYRDFALAHPITYTLAFTSLSPDQRPDANLLELLALPLQSIMAELTGEVEALTALRGLWALVHGFVMLELSEQFQRGGDLNDVFVQTIETYVRGLEVGRSEV